MLLYPLPKPMTVEEFLLRHHPDYGINPWLNYCEICIDSKGNIYECIPSHQEFGISYMCKEFAKTRDELVALLPSYISPLHYAAERCHLLFLWHNYAIGYKDYHTDIITTVLEQLNEAGLFQGHRIPKVDISHEYTIVKMHGDDKF